MAFPTVGGTNSGANAVNSSSHTINLPSNIATGDRVIVFCTWDGLQLPVWPAGWTSLVALADWGTMRFQARYRDIDGTEGFGAGPNTITVTNTGSEMTAHATIRIASGTFNSLAAPELQSAFTDPTNSSPNPPSLTPSWGAADTLWIVAYGWDGNNSHSGYPANYSSNQVTNRAVATGGCGVSMATRNLNASSEDPGTGSISATDEWEAVTVAIRPAAAGTSLPVFVHHYKQQGAI